MVLNVQVNKQAVKPLTYCKVCRKDHGDNAHRCGVCHCCGSDLSVSPVVKQITLPNCPACNGKGKRVPNYDDVYECTQCHSHYEIARGIEFVAHDRPDRAAEKNEQLLEQELRQRRNHLQRGRSHHLRQRK